MNDLVIKKLKACKELPSIPAAASKILELAQDPNATMNDVANAISLDPALSSKILRTANSPLYGKRQADTLNQAAVLLGMNAMTTIALSFSLAAVVKKDSNGGINYELLWRRTLLTAAIARVIAETTSKAPVEETFLAALLQDIGIMALDQAMPELYDKLQAEQQANHYAFTSYEQETIQCDHVQAGSWLLQQWNLPDVLVQAVSLSHSGHINQDNAVDAALAQSVNVAGLVAEVLSPNVSTDVLYTTMERAKRYWNVDSDWLSKLQQALTQEIQDIEKLFETSLIECDEIDTLLTEARETLLLRSLLTAKRLEEEQIVCDEIRQQANAAEEKSKRDTLTGLYNREFANEFMDEQFDHITRKGQPLSVIFIDLDRFKLLNDNYGHETGDKALQHAAELLDDTLREEDYVCRWGGEEFLVILSNSDEKTARLVGDRLVTTFRNNPMIQDDADDICVTISAGVATLNRQSNYSEVNELIAAADKAMYQAKSSGRDQLACA